jgi:predicted HicB family RNase H-like nuclease
MNQASIGRDSDAVLRLRALLGECQGRPFRVIHTQRWTRRTHEACIEAAKIAGVSLNQWVLDTCIRALAGGE